MSTLTQDDKKRAVARKAIDFVPDDSIIGVGTGSTVNFFIDELARIKARIDGCVSSSDASTARLKAHGIPVYELSSVGELEVYIDGADEVNHSLHMIKGGGGALTREKIVAASARKFICIADEAKYVAKLGTFPVAVEVIPMARSLVARELVHLGGHPELRQGFTTDNGNLILDVHNLEILKPVEMETAINQIPGVVCCGIFARQHAHVLLLGTDSGVKEIR